METDFTCAFAVDIADCGGNRCHNEKDDRHLDKADKDIAYKLEVRSPGTYNRTERDTTYCSDEDKGGKGKFFFVDSAMILPLF